MERAPSYSPQIRPNQVKKGGRIPKKYSAIKYLVAWNYRWWSSEGKEDAQGFCLDGGRGPRQATPTRSQKGKRKEILPRSKTTGVQAAARGIQDLRTSEGKDPDGAELATVENSCAVSGRREWLAAVETSWEGLALSLDLIRWHPSPALIKYFWDSNKGSVITIKVVRDEQFTRTRFDLHFAKGNSQLL